MYDDDPTADMVGKRGFGVAVHLGQTSRREEIEEACKREIANTPWDSTDPVVVYCSGHDGRGALDGAEECQCARERSHRGWPWRRVVPRATGERRSRSRARRLSAVAVAAVAALGPIVRVARELEPAAAGREIRLHSRCFLALGRSAIDRELAEGLDFAYVIVHVYGDRTIVIGQDASP
ncbi:hypothetical protein [Agromyces bracchium]|uniref:Uncharacterized protein n=1 Tax=Agromyces bracchium TaxID=88376 RepID=A0A6I3MHP5_9MICO|nr:hypothetical protein [Agromyces bracchium]MTH69833.1 hypothetical protein [Agromyces bracchium]